MQVGKFLRDVLYVQSQILRDLLYVIWEFVEGYTICTVGCC
jgi:hypothetical protein